jgi:hypothetical protein
MAVTHGSCLCGDVAWELDGPLEFMSHCHCSRCRKAHGTAFATYVMAPADRFRLVRGAAGIVRYPSSPGFERPFCGRCGAVVPSGDAQQGLVAVPAGPLDDDPGVRPIVHIFVGSKAPWFDIAGALPQFDEYPPGIDAPTVPAPTPPPGEGEGLHGSCLCGAVRFVATGAMVRCQHCHCSRCRKARAAAHASNWLTTIDGLRFVAGEEHLDSYKVPGARYFAHVFCKTCGSPMPRRDPGRNLAVVPMGSFDDDPRVRPAFHIYVGSKAPWYEIADGLPQYDEMPPPR